MQLLRKLRLPDLVTLLGIAMILAAIRLLTLGGYKKAIGLMLLSVLCDFLDGYLARRYGGSIYGKYLDSLYDLMGYLIFPAVYFLRLYPAVVYLIPAVIVILAGCLRLARFSAQGLTNGDYEGMPVFYISFVPLALYLSLNRVIIILYLLIASVLMISRVKFAKPKHPVFAAALLVAGIGFLI